MLEPNMGIRKTIGDVINHRYFSDFVNKEDF